MACQQKLVLIVNDDQAVRDALQFSLRLEGLYVRAHSESGSLLADPDLDQAGCVVVDHRLPQIDGFALLGSLKERNISLPAIMLTSHANALVSARANAVGVHVLLEKPLLDDALIDNIRAILCA